MRTQQQALEQIRDRVEELPEAIEIARETLAMTPTETLTREERQAVVATLVNAPQDQNLHEALRKLRMEEAWEDERERAKELVA